MGFDVDTRSVRLVVTNMTHTLFTIEKCQLSGEMVRWIPGERPVAGRILEGNQTVHWGVSASDFGSPIRAEVLLSEGDWSFPIELQVDDAGLPRCLCPGMSEIEAQVLRADPGDPQHIRFSVVLDLA